jgi:hypothetical protein
MLIKIKSSVLQCISSSPVDTRQQIEQRAASQNRTSAVNTKDKIMKTHVQDHVPYDLVEILSRSVMATLIVGLSLAASLVAVMAAISV